MKKSDIKKLQRAIKLIEQAWDKINDVEGVLYDAGNIDDSTTLADVCCEISNQCHYIQNVIDNNE